MSIVGIVSYRPDGTITYINQYMADLMGYPREDLIGRSSLDFLAPEERESVIKTQNELKEHKHVLRECRITRKDGSDLWTRVELNPRKDKSGNPVGYLAVHTDITEQKQVEKALQDTRILQTDSRESQLENMGRI